MTGFVVFAHGSRIDSANASVHSMAAALEQEGYSPAVAAFLELAHPDLAEAVGLLASRGVRRIIVLPYFLTMGIHLTRDLPRIARELESIYKEVEVIVTEPLDGHPALLQILRERAQAGLAMPRQQQLNGSCDSDCASH